MIPSESVVVKSKEAIKLKVLYVILYVKTKLKERNQQTIYYDTVSINLYTDTIVISLDSRTMFNMIWMQ